MPRERFIVVHQLDQKKLKMIRRIPIQLTLNLMLYNIKRLWNKIKKTICLRSLLMTIKMNKYKKSYQYSETILSHPRISGLKRILQWHLMAQIIMLKSTLRQQINLTNSKCNFSNNNSNNFNSNYHHLLNHQQQ